MLFLYSIDTNQENNKKRYTYLSINMTVEPRISVHTDVIEDGVLIATLQPYTINQDKFFIVYDPERITYSAFFMQNTKQLLLRYDYSLLHKRYLNPVKFNPNTQSYTPCTEKQCHELTAPYRINISADIFTTMTDADRTIHIPAHLKLLQPKNDPVSLPIDFHTWIDEIVLATKETVLSPAIQAEVRQIFLQPWEIIHKFIIEHSKQLSPDIYAIVLHAVLIGNIDPKKFDSFSLETSLIDELLSYVRYFRSFFWSKYIDQYNLRSSKTPTSIGAICHYQKLLVMNALKTLNFTIDPNTIPPLPAEENKAVGTLASASQVNANAYIGLPYMAERTLILIEQANTLDIAEIPEDQVDNLIQQLQDITSNDPSDTARLIADEWLAIRQAQGNNNEDLMVLLKTLLDKLQFPKKVLAWLEQLPENMLAGEITEQIELNCGEIHTLFQTIPLNKYPLCWSKVHSILIQGNRLGLLFNMLSSAQRDALYILCYPELNDIIQSSENLSLMLTPLTAEQALAVCRKLAPDFNKIIKQPGDLASIIRPLLRFRYEENEIYLIFSSQLDKYIKSSVDLYCILSYCPPAECATVIDKIAPHLNNIIQLTTSQDFITVLLNLSLEKSTIVCHKLAYYLHGKMTVENFNNIYLFSIYPNIVNMQWSRAEKAFWAGFSPYLSSIIKSASDFHQVLYGLTDDKRQAVYTICGVKRLTEMIKSLSDFANIVGCLAPEANTAVYNVCGAARLTAMLSSLDDVWLLFDTLTLEQCTSFVEQLSPDFNQILQFELKKTNEKNYYTTLRDTFNRLPQEKQDAVYPVFAPLLTETDDKLTQSTHTDGALMHYMITDSQLFVAERRQVPNQDLTSNTASNYKI